MQEAPAEPFSAIPQSSVALVRIPHRPPRSALFAVFLLSLNVNVLAGTLSPDEYDADHNGIIDDGPEAAEWLAAANRELSPAPQMTAPIAPTPRVDVESYALETGTISASFKLSDEETKEERKYTLESGWDFRQLGKLAGTYAILGAYLKGEHTRTELATETTEVERITLQPLKLQWEGPYNLFAIYLKGGLGYSESTTENLADGTRERTSNTEYTWTPGLVLRTCVPWLSVTLEHEIHMDNIASDKISDITSLGVKLDFMKLRDGKRPPGCGAGR